MATPPDFTVGQVLTAAQMNQIGLWKMVPTGATGGTVATNGDVTIGSTQSELIVTAAFTSDFDNYLIQMCGGSVSVADVDIRMQLRTSGGTNSTANYYSALVYSTGSSATPVAFNSNNGSEWPNAGGSISTTLPTLNMTLFSPNVARRTAITNHFVRGSALGTVNGFHDVATAYNSFRIYPASGTITGCVVRIYGYN